MGKMLLIFSCYFFINNRQAAAQLRLTSLPDSGTQKISLKVLPQNFYNQHLSYVCKKEVQLQKLTSLPLFIRLGSKDYVDYLEKKPNATVNKQ